MCKGFKLWPSWFTYTIKSQNSGVLLYICIYKLFSIVSCSQMFERWISWLLFSHMWYGYNYINLLCFHFFSYRRVLTPHTSLRKILLTSSINLKGLCNHKQLWLLIHNRILKLKIYTNFIHNSKIWPQVPLLESFNESYLTSILTCFT